MSFVINKRSKKWGEVRSLYYLVESYREDNKGKRRTLLPLGECKNLNEFLDLTERREAMALSMIKSDEKKLVNLSPWERERLVRIIGIRKNHLQRCRTTKEKIMQLMSL